MKHILVIDDAKDTTDLVKLILESSGYECTTVNNAKEGVNIMDNDTFDLVLLDLAMPDFSGLDVLKELKKTNSLDKNKIILFSASPTFSDVEIEKLKIEYGIADRMRKPFSKTELLGVIQKHLI